MEIIVTFVGPNTVRADLNPQPVSGGDEVTWKFDASRELQVSFVTVLDQDQPQVDGSNPAPCNPLGPLESVSIGAGIFEGKVRTDIPNGTGRMTRYFYKLFENGVELFWDPSVDGKPGVNGGGLDTSGRPAGGGGGGG